MHAFLLLQLCDDSLENLVIGDPDNEPEALSPEIPLIGHALKCPPIEERTLQCPPTEEPAKPGTSSKSSSQDSHISGPKIAPAFGKKKRTKQSKPHANTKKDSQSAQEESVLPTSQALPKSVVGDIDSKQKLSRAKKPASSAVKMRASTPIKDDTATNDDDVSLPSAADIKTKPLFGSRKAKKAAPKKSSDAPKAKELENEGKVVEREQQKIELEAKKMEQEEKKQAKELKKQEREQKKAEREKAKEEKRLVLERKKAEKEQKKIEKDLKKLEREQRKTDKKSKSKESNKENIDGSNICSQDSKTVIVYVPSEPNDISTGMESVTDNANNVATDDAIDSGITGINATGDIDTATSDPHTTVTTDNNTVPTSDHGQGSDKDSPLDDEDRHTNQDRPSSNQSTPSLRSQSGGNDDDCTPKQAQSSTSSGNRSLTTTALSIGEGSCFGPTAKKSHKKSSSAKASKKRPTDQLSTKPTKKNKLGGSSAGRGQDDSLWVQCDRPSCFKWRLLRGVADPALLPDKWYCSMNKGIRCVT